MSFLAPWIWISFGYDSERKANCNEKGYSCIPGPYSLQSRPCRGKEDSHHSVESIDFSLVNGFVRNTGYLGGFCIAAPAKIIG